MHIPNDIIFSKWLANQMMKYYLSSLPFSKTTLRTRAFYSIFYSSIFKNKFQKLIQTNQIFLCSPWHSNPRFIHQKNKISRQYHL
uniref:Uncharacterized protein n=1 Tax=Solanum lycopersicum TaxID=4081 RepID=A0A3Q7HLX6_SOLLC